MKDNGKIINIKCSDENNNWEAKALVNIDGIVFGVLKDDKNDKYFSGCYKKKEFLSLYLLSNIPPLKIEKYYAIRNGENEYICPPLMNASTPIFTIIEQLDLDNCENATKEEIKKAEQDKRDILSGIYYFNKKMYYMEKDSEDEITRKRTLE